MTKIFKRALPMLLAIALLTGCGQTGTSGGVSDTGTSSEVAPSDVGAEEDFDGAGGIELEEPNEDMYVDVVEMEEVELADELVALAGPAVSTKVKPVASGAKTVKQQKATIDYSNAADGYVMAKFTASTTKTTKVKVTGPKSEYVYTITPGEWCTFTLADGNGSYTIKVYENTTGNKFAVVCSATFSVTLKDEFGPFLYPNQYVDYESAPNTVAQAQKLAGSQTDPMKKVEAIYNYVVKTLKYDYDFAASVQRGEQNGYMPDLDQVLKNKKGVCFDYAALMAGMLRAQGVPCKLVMGYITTSQGKQYHAWINVYSEKDGWINGAIKFNGKKWMRMDPTQANGNVEFDVNKYKYQETQFF